MKISMANNERTESERLGQLQVEVARKCLGLIRDIAKRGAASWDPADVGYALQELSQVLLERTGIEDRKVRARCPQTRFRASIDSTSNSNGSILSRKNMSARKLYN